MVLTVQLLLMRSLVWLMFTRNILLSGGNLTDMKRTGLTTRYVLSTLALSSLVWAAPAGAQSQGMTPQTQQTAPQQAPGDVTRADLSTMYAFMDSHPDIAQELQKDPSLVDNRQYLADHPQLEQLLASHPELRDAIKSNPNAYMRQQDRFDRGKDRTEVATFDEFLDHHPEIAEQLKKDPSLIDNRKWVAEHQSLQSFLADHPELREAFRDHPNAFMRQEDRYDNRGQGQGYGIDRAELANMDRFLDSHPEIAEQLKKDPSLVDNKKWLAQHPALKEYLASHPQIAQTYEQHPNLFMQDEDRFDRNQGMPRGVEVASFHEFLQEKPGIASELSKNPELATNSEYLANHSELQTYLKANPQVSQQLSQNPQSFVKAAQGTEMTSPKATGTPKLPGTEPK